MNLTLERFGFGHDSTLGEMLVDGIHQCWTIEDERRVDKVWGETCIPVGRYRIWLRKDGERHERYLVRFPGVHVGVLQLRDVIGFTGVQIHPGNDDDDTSGCILPNTHPVILQNGEFEGSASTPAYLALYRLAIEAMGRGEEVWIVVKEREPE